MMGEYAMCSKCGEIKDTVTRTRFCYVVCRECADKIDADRDKAMQEFSKLQLSLFKHTKKEAMPK